MAAQTSIRLTTESQKLLVDYVNSAYEMYDKVNRRQYMEWMDKQYVRRYDMSADTIKSQLASLRGDPTKFRNIVYPLVMPQVEAAVAYQTEVFCSGVPLFPIVTSPEYASAGLQMETVIDSHAQRGAWGTEFSKAFRNAYKYNECAIFVDWDIRMGVMAQSAGNAEEANKPVWQGNVVRSLDMYNTFRDPRVPLSEVTETGEFAGFTKRMPLTMLRSYILGLPTKLLSNYGAALDSNKAGESKFNTPNIGTSLFAKAVAGEFNWYTHLGITAGGTKQYNLGNVFDVTTVVIRIAPRDFKISGVAATGTPQLFKIVIVNWQHVIHFSQVTTEHDQLPILFAQAYEDGLDSQTASMVENIEPMQQIATALVNSSMAARRRSIADRAIYNPMLIESRDVNSDSPTAKIAMKPSALLLSSPDKAYYPIPFNDNVSAQALSEVGVVERMSYAASGQNPMRQGQFMKGNKTRTEVNTVMDNSVAGDRMSALHFESRIFAPLKLQLKYNILKYQGGETMFNQQKRQSVEITPQAMQEALLTFKISDGLTPASKVANSEFLQVAMQTVQAVPQLQQEYSLGKLFGGIMQAGGVPLDDYRYTKAEQQYLQQLGAWQQAAAQAAEAGAAFNTPQPVPPQPEQ